jgi:hypothetical protein
VRKLPLCIVLNFQSLQLSKKEKRDVAVAGKARLQVFHLISEPTKQPTNPTKNITKTSNLAARFFPFAFIRIKKKIVTLFNEAAKMMGLFSFGQEAQVFFTSAMIRSQIAALSL